MRSSKILIVDDFSSFRRFVCSVLQQTTEFRVSEASDGLDAVQKARELEPDLILLDVGLPQLNGIEVCKRVRKLTPSPRVLFLSQESDPDVVREALRVGALGYVRKSRTHSELLTAIKAVIVGKRFVSTGLEWRSLTHAAQISIGKR